MKIQSLHLENYRCFENFDIDFDKNLTVLVGVNGAGKTNILDALTVFCKYIMGSQRGNYSAILCKSSDLSIKYKKDEIHINIKIFSHDKPLQWTFIESQTDPDTFPIKEHPHSLIYDFLQKKAQEKSLLCLPYSAQRCLPKDLRGSPQGGRPSAFTQAFDANINFQTSLKWFNDKDAAELRQRRDMKQNGDRNAETYEDPELKAVRHAVAEALSDGDYAYEAPRMVGSPPALVIRNKDTDTDYEVTMLSDGYRTMLALVMDLARRMAIANEHIVWPEGQSVLYSQGIVLIDEIELHLHPSWQQTVLPTLTRIFPNVQFIVTTHSPQVLTSIAAKHIRVLKKGQAFPLPENDETEGADSARLLQDVLGVDPRPGNGIAKKLKEYSALVYGEQWDSPQAESLRAELDAHYHDAEPMLKELELHIENSKWEREL